MRVAIIGAGAAGLAPAIFAARAAPQLDVRCLDGAARVGAKILVSGGSRCNVTNRVVTERDFHAEVTAGGIPLDEIDPATMESGACQRLYLVGEILAVDGRLGGFNFQWSWSSARVAGRAIARASGAA